MEPPTITAQEHEVAVGKNGKPFFYDPPELKDAKKKLTAHLMAHRPGEPFMGPVELVATWCFPWPKSRQKDFCILQKALPLTSMPDHEWRMERPDTDNLDKLLKDCMTKCGFWKDDAQVCREIIEKYNAWIPGIRIRVTRLA